ncbi:MULTISPECIES: tRNA dihydrouridine(20/20a) synthase DusA [unclassified Beijerinckia]|uniref:tRNA dihydrouridine(20/20a) synthase DusA n=1 Tax=unclassified Beijerinckia TaxID=2638183 RepID=UPI000896A444|nr:MULTISPECIES: tRNA dihydrouridine(20/20a) synthase DusA [unclassified Beijerinckia]MDH7796286.1 tRNA-dihydrouridine synthase A [Beijerinckia sp. GAS462]SEC38479.1 tRNA-U16,U17-dihydrouridine synthase [Beijerinckia sp. 28-YEA-48]
MSILDIRFSVAPMMDWSDTHCRFLHRLLSRRALLYTEMVTTGAILFGPRERLLAYHAAEHPVALQLGGSEPEALAQCARIGADFGYDEINLNCGCPSDRVQNGAFGACLMREPDLVAASVAAMKAVVNIPVTVKCRIGVDDQEPREALWTMAEKLRAAGVDALIVHARKAWLKGLSPKENRDVPPLDYPLVHALKRDFPDMPIAINGGLRSMDVIKAQLEQVDGAMVGREAYQNPGMLLEVDPQLFGQAAPVTDAFEAVVLMEPYIADELAKGARLSDITRHMLGLFAGMHGARAFRRHLATEAVKRGAGLEVLRAAVALVSRDASRADQAQDAA